MFIYVLVIISMNYNIITPSEITTSVAAYDTADKCLEASAKFASKNLGEMYPCTKIQVK